VGQVSGRSELEGKSDLPPERRQRSAEGGDAGDVVDVRGREVGRCVDEAGG
jgi:hypothetical protein